MNITVLFIGILLLIYLVYFFYYKPINEYFKKKKNKKGIIKKIKQIGKKFKRFAKKVKTLAKNLKRWENKLDLLGTPPNPDFTQVGKIINTDDFEVFKEELKEIVNLWEPVSNMLWYIAELTIAPPPINNIASTTVLALSVPAELADISARYLGEVHVIEYKYIIFNITGNTNLIKDHKDLNSEKIELERIKLKTTEGFSSIIESFGLFGRRRRRRRGSRSGRRRRRRRRGLIKVISKGLSKGLKGIKKLSKTDALKKVNEIKKKIAEAGKKVKKVIKEIVLYSTSLNLENESPRPNYTKAEPILLSSEYIKFQSLVDDYLFLIPWYAIVFALLGITQAPSPVNTIAASLLKALAFPKGKSLLDIKNKCIEYSYRMRTVECKFILYKLLGTTRLELSDLQKYKDGTTTGTGIIPKKELESGAISGGLGVNNKEISSLGANMYGTSGVDSSMYETSGVDSSMYETSGTVTNFTENPNNSNTYQSLISRFNVLSEESSINDTDKDCNTCCDDKSKVTEEKGLLTVYQGCNSCC